MRLYTSEGNWDIGKSLLTFKSHFSLPSYPSTLLPSLLSHQLFVPSQEIAGIVLPLQIHSSSVTTSTFYYLSA